MRSPWTPRSEVVDTPPTVAGRVRRDQSPREPVDGRSGCGRATGRTTLECHRDPRRGSDRCRAGGRRPGLSGDARRGPRRSHCGRGDGKRGGAHPGRRQRNGARHRLRRAGPRAERSGVSRFVLAGVPETMLDVRVPVARTKRRVELLLVESGLSWVLVPVAPSLAGVMGAGPADGHVGDRPGHRRRRRAARPGPGPAQKGRADPPREGGDTAHARRPMRWWPGEPSPTRTSR
jgi:hypothetical protein